MLTEILQRLNLAQATYQQGNPQAAIAQVLSVYDRTQSREALNLVLCWGNEALNSGVWQTAITCFQAILDRHPDHTEARCHLGMAQLCLGQLVAGFANYETRPPRLGFIQDMQRYLPHVPRWETAIDPTDLTTSLAGQTLLVMAEQGFGDAIQFARFAMALSDRGARVILGCRPPLVRLLATVPGVAAIHQPNQPVPPVTGYTLLMSLPHQLGITLQTIPATVPYLRSQPLSPQHQAFIASCSANQDASEQYATDRHATDLNTIDRALRVGVVWSGNAMRFRDGERSLSLSVIEPLLNLATPHAKTIANTKNVKFFSLQKDPPIADRQRFSSLGLVDLDPFLTDFADTASFIDHLDLVITVDTAVAHLAGALGKPVWVILGAVADWRWMLDRTDSPWYPTMRLFRQPRSGDWRSVIDAVTTALRQVLQTNFINSTVQTLQAVQPISAIQSNIQANVLQAMLQAAIAAFQADNLAQTEQLCQRLLQQHAPHLAHPGQPITEISTTLNLLGMVAYRRHQLTVAIEWFQRTLHYQASYVNAYLNLAGAYRDLGQIDAALHCYDRVAQLAPASVDMQWERSLTLLVAGRYREGFADYEIRRQRGRLPPQITNDPPFWEGQQQMNLNGQTLFLRISQGFGDAIQSVRYVPQLAAQGIRVVIEARSPLKRLFQTVAGVHQVIEVGDSLDPWRSPQRRDRDRQALMLSLPHLCQTTLETIPNTVPYLQVPSWSRPETQADINRRLSGIPPLTVTPNSTTTVTLNSAPTATPYKIGVVWSGSPTHQQDYRRSMTLAEFAPLLQTVKAVQGQPVQFFSLQTPVRDRDRPLFNQLCEAGTLIDLGSAVHDFGDTAYLLDHLDLIIAVDTSVIHLAGALGKTAWVLLAAAADWRWLLDRSDSPWYPSVRLFRQRQLGNWHTVIHDVQTSLQNKNEVTTPPRRPTFNLTPDRLSVSTAMMIEF